MELFSLKKAIKLNGIALIKFDRIEVHFIWIEFKLDGFYIFLNGIL